MESVTYTLLKVEVLNISMPRPNFTADNDSLMWHYKQSIHYAKANTNQTIVEISFAYYMYAKNDPLKQKICEIETRSTFNADRLISATGKITLLLRFLDIALWNLQGIYAAKTQHVFLGRNVPPQINFKEQEQSLKEGINEYWK